MLPHRWGYRVGFGSRGGCWRGNATPPHDVLLRAWDEAQFLGADQGAQLEQIQELQAKLDEERESLRLL
jgi:hypothetical protein